MMLLFDEDDLLQAREDAEALMLDVCDITRPTGESTMDPDTGKVTPQTAPVLTGQKCAVQQAAGGTAPEAGEHVYTLQVSQLKLPVGVGPVQVNDVVTMRKSINPALIGNIYRITGTFEKTFLSAQRIPVEEITG